MRMHDELLDEARGVLDDAIQLRRSIHREPEVGLALPLTQAKVLAALEGLPLEARTGQRTTSVVADLRGARPGPVVLLRADMDGTVRCMFQPGEEGYAGARIMLEEGLLDGGEGAPSAAFALHASPRWAAGTITTRPGPVLASSDTFTIRVRGRGGHASAPHLAADPVPVACEMVMAIQTLVTRALNIFAPGVVTVGKIQAGTTGNIIPETATLRGTVRTVAPATRRHILAGLERVA